VRYSLPTLADGPSLIKKKVIPAGGMASGVYGTSYFNTLLMKASLTFVCAGLVKLHLLKKKGKYFGFDLLFGPSVKYREVLLKVDKKADLLINDFCINAGVLLAVESH